MTHESFNGKTLMITGGGTGIGKGCAGFFLAQGARVTIAGPDETVLRQAVEELTRTTGRDTLQYAVCDVTVEEDVARATELAACGGALDLMLANAGTGMPGPVQLMDKAQWHFAYDVNVVGTALCIKHASRFMKPARRGAIVAISSVEALRASRFMPAYNVTKAALDSLVPCAARELGPFGIRVNGIRPGVILTETLKASVSEQVLSNGLRHAYLGRHGEPLDIARAVAFLASDAASFITGQMLNVCGGLTVHDGDSYEGLARMVFGDEAIDHCKPAKESHP